MLLGEPRTTPYDLHFQLGRIPVRVHPLFWLMTLFLGAQGGDAVDVIIFVAVCFVSILTHELGHAIAMRLFGEFPRIVLYMMGGLAISDGGYVRGRFSAGQRGRRGAWQQIVISAAGPGAGFLLAGLVIVLVLAGHGEIRFRVPSLDSLIFWELQLEKERLYQLVSDLLLINIIWGCINLLPIHPLDGGQITRQLFAIFNPALAVRNSLYVSIVAAAIMAFVGLAIWQAYFTGVFFAYLAAISYLSLRSPW